MPVSAFVLNTRHELLIWNKAYEQLTGLKTEYTLGSDPHWLGFTPENVPI